jgi:hypothetical protein
VVSKHLSFADTCFILVQHILASAFRRGFFNFRGRLVRRALIRTRDLLQQRFLGMVVSTSRRVPWCRPASHRATVGKTRTRKSHRDTLQAEAADRSVLLIPMFTGFCKRKSGTRCSAAYRGGCFGEARASGGGARGLLINAMRDIASSFLSIEIVRGTFSVRRRGQ